MTKFLNNVDVTGYISQTSVTSSLLKTDSSGKLVAAVAGTDYNAPNVSAVAGTLIREVRNATGATLTKGTVVYISGATGNKATVSKAIATGDSTSAQTFGLCQTDIANNSNGYVVCVGDITGLDTSAFTEGVQLYLSSTTAGAYTSTKQYAPAHLVYVGVVTRSHPTLGQIEVKIQNGYELDELHNVSAQTPSNNDGLFWEASTSLWKTKSIPTVLGYTPANAATTLTINGTAYDLSANRSWTIAPGSSARTENIFTATSGQTTFTIAGGYTAGLVDVYVNGVKLLPADFTATNGTTVVLATGAVLNDSVTIINYTAIITALPTSRDVFDYTATSGQTAFTVSGGYAVGLLDVFVNGVKLTSSEYTATNGTSFTLTVASVLSDQVQAIRYNSSITGISGSGTANYLPKFTASGTVANSLIQDDGTNVIIGSTNSALLMPRAATSNDAAINFATGGTTKWTVGLRSTYTTDDFYIWNPGLGIPFLTLSSGSSLANFGVAVRASSFTSYLSSGIFLVNSSGGTNAVQMRINNTGGDLRMGMESSAGGVIQNGTLAYAAVLGNQANYPLQFTTNGSVKMTIDNAGNVGIGVTTMSTKLDILGDVRIQGGGSVSYAVLNMLDNTSGGSNWAIFSGYPALGNFTIRESGVANHLVIAKTTGAATFSGSVTAGTSIYWGGTPNNNLSAGSMSMVDTATGTRYLQLSVTNTIANIATNYSSSNIPLSLNSYGNTNQLYLATDGKVGIGTASPGTALAVNAGTAGSIVSMNSNRTGGGGVIIQNNGSDRMYLGNANWMGISGESTSSTNISLSTSENSAIVFARNAAYSVVETMRITNSGTARFLQSGVGSYSIIGTIAPNNIGDRYLHIRISTVAGMMFWVKVMGYTYGTGLSEGLAAGYLYGSTGALFQGYYSGSIVAGYFNTSTNYSELVIDTLTSATSNRFGSYTFFGGNDNLASPVPLEIVSYVWNSSTARYY